MAKKTTRKRRPRAVRVPTELPPCVKLLRILAGHKEMIRSLAFDPQGEILASGSTDETVKLWETRSGKLLRTLQGHKSSASCLAFTPQYGVLASGNADGLVELWEA